MNGKFARTLLAAAALAMAPAALAHAEGYTTTDAPKVSDETPSPGQEVHVEFDGFAPSSTVTLELHSTPLVLGTFQADGNGAVVVDVTIPADFSLGHHDIVARGTSPTGEAVVDVAGVEVSKPGSDHILALTGSEARGLMAFGSILIVVGATATVATRKRLRAED